VHQGLGIEDAADEDDEAEGIEHEGGHGGLSGRRCRQRKRPRRGGGSRYPLRRDVQ
jgi:hypothetical protein